MLTKRKILSKIRTKSILIGILYLIGLLSLYNDADQIKRGRPYVYPTTVILRCFVVRIWLRIPSNNCLHHYFEINLYYNRKVMRACGLYTLPDRRTFDRRFKMIPIQHIIDTIGARFLAECLPDVSIVSVDSSMIRARNNRVWHRKQMIHGTIPRSALISMQGGGSLEPRDGCMDTNCTCHAALVLLWCRCQHV
jgi:hypothetical protein